MPAAEAPTLLHLAQDRIERLVAAGRLLEGSRLAADDAVALEEHGYPRVGALGVVDRRVEQLGHERPAAGDRGRSASRAALRGTAELLERREGVVRDAPAPNQARQGLVELAGAQVAELDGELRGEGRASRLEMAEHRGLRFGRGLVGRGLGDQQAGAVPTVEGDAAVRRAQGRYADPDDRPGGGEHVEHLDAEVRNPPGQDAVEERRPGERKSLELRQSLLEAGERGPVPRPGGGVDALPLGEELTEDEGLDGGNLLAELRERAPLQSPEHGRIAPLGLVSVGADLSTHDLAARLERAQHGLDLGRRHAETTRRVVGEEGAVGAREAPDEPGEGVVHGLEDAVGEPGRRHDAESVAVSSRVGDGDVAMLAGDADPGDAALRVQPFEPRSHGLGRPLGELVLAEIADAAEEVLELVGAPRAIAVGAAGELLFQLGEDLGVDQVAELRLPEELAEQVARSRVSAWAFRSASGASYS